ncbi:MAG: 1,4-alpha-glucan branching protein domain-containing protein [Kouleothrix sp.]
MIEAFAERRNLALTTPSKYLSSLRPRFGVTLREGSWATEAYHQLWDTPAARPLHRAISEVEERVAVQVRRYPNAQGERERALSQAVRELLLAQSSDWPLASAAAPAMMRSGARSNTCAAASAYAHSPTTTHGRRMTAHCSTRSKSGITPTMLNYRVFAP